MEGGAPTRGPLLILGAALLWGTTGTAQALAPASASPTSVGAVRMVVGGLGLLVASGVGGTLTVPARGLRPWWLVSAGAVAAYQVFFFAAVARAGVALGTVVAIGSAPVLAGALAAWVRAERPGLRWVIATALGGFGVVLIGGGVGGGDLGGVALALLAGASYAVYAVGSKRLVEEMPSPAAMALVFATAGVILLPLALSTDLGWLGEANGWLAAAWLGLVATTVAYLLFGKGLQHTEVSTTATLSLAEPITATVLGVALLGERPGLAAWAGVAAILAGLVILGTAKRRAVQSA